MAESAFSEPEAAAMLPGKPHERTLRRWRQAGKVPFCRTPGGRIYYTFEQLVKIGTDMRVEVGRAWSPSAQQVRLCPDMSGEVEAAAE